MFEYPKVYDVVVIGAGHAGVEAALASARMGCETLLLTMNLDTIGQMSCNPAIGGLAKGQIVREIDALGGEMALNTDATGIQFRMLNASKGPSVRGPRAQCDKKAYQFRLKATCERQERLDVKQGHIAEILIEGERVTGVSTQLGVIYQSRTVVVTTGTFLQGLMHVGLRNTPGGRMGDTASGLSASLLKLGFELGKGDGYNYRFKMTARSGRVGVKTLRSLRRGVRSRDFHATFATGEEGTVASSTLKSQRSFFR